MRLLPALLLSAAVHASVLALAAPQPAVEDLRLEVAIHLEAAGHGKGGGQRTSRCSSGASPRDPGRKEARRPVQPPPPEPVMAAPIPAPKPRQPLNAAAPPVEPRARKPIRTATPKAKPPEPPRDSIHTATSAQTPPSDQTAPSARGAAPARTTAQEPSAQEAPQPSPTPRKAPVESSRDLVAALARSLVDRNAASSAPGPPPGPASGMTTGAVQFGSDEGPRFLKRAAIEYPRGALRADRQGRVVVLLELDERGTLLRADIAESAGPRLDRAALRFARASTYAPAARKGHPVPCKALLPITFNLTR